MAMWYQPRQIMDGERKGKWHYTAASDESSFCYAVGPCGEGCPGHDTAEEATRHYVEGICRSPLAERDDDHEQRKCFVCGAWTQHRAHFVGENFESEHAICVTGHDIRAALSEQTLKRYELS